jgi:hypothetical protein
LPPSALPNSVKVLLISLIITAERAPVAGGTVFGARASTDWTNKCLSWSNPSRLSWLVTAEVILTRWRLKSDPHPIVAGWQDCPRGRWPIASAITDIIPEPTGAPDRLETIGAPERDRRFESFPSLWQRRMTVVLTTIYRDLRDFTRAGARANVNKSTG